MELESKNIIKATEESSALARSACTAGYNAPKPKVRNCETAKEIETRIAFYFGTRANVIVPNVYWGLMPYECDMLVMPMSGHVYEIEIKVSKGDLVADKKKNHTHDSDRVRKLYFAIPEKLEKHIEHIPAKAGILIVNKTGGVRKLREPEVNLTAIKLSAQEQFQLARLGAMRVWTLKHKLLSAV